jgi:hypothetical protein
VLEKTSFPNSNETFIVSRIKFQTERDARIVETGHFFVPIAVFVVPTADTPKNSQLNDPPVICTMIAALETKTMNSED